MSSLRPHHHKGHRGSADSDLVSEDNLDYAGSSRYIRRPSHRFIPGSKQWHMGHNLKGQEDDLIEDLPVGLRRARLCCVVSCTVVAALLSLVTLALLIWAMTVLDVDTYGPEGAVFRDRAVGFLKPVECTGQVAIGQGDYVVRSTANEPLNVAAADSYRLTARSATARSTSSISSTPADVTFNASKMTARSAVNESDIYFEMDPEQSYVRSRRAFFDTPAVRTAGNAKVQTSILRAPVGEDMELASTSNMTLTAFRDLALTAQLGNVLFTADDLTLAARQSGVVGALSMSSPVVALDMASLLASSGSVVPAATYTVCTCNNGQLFVVDGSTLCPSTPGAAVCA